VDNCSAQPAMTPVRLNSESDAFIGGHIRAGVVCGVPLGHPGG
jgi:hypothetical protein